VRSRRLFDEMGANAVAFTRALGLNKADVLGFSIGGMVAQEIALQAPDLVRKLILVGTGPRGGQGMASLTQTRDGWPQRRIADRRRLSGGPARARYDAAHGQLSQGLTAIRAGPLASCGCVELRKVRGRAQR
jgi:pimeloyl-ACP methyl ester carboxylesterase